MTALNNLASACEYESAAQMLIENVDYLINAVALRLNAFDVSRKWPTSHKNDDRALWQQNFAAP